MKLLPVLGKFRQKTTSGAVVYTFVNKVTGMTLAVDPTFGENRDQRSFW